MFMCFKMMRISTLVTSYFVKKHDCYKAKLSRILKKRKNEKKKKKKTVKCTKQINLNFKIMHSFYIFKSLKNRHFLNKIVDQAYK